MTDDDSFAALRAQSGALSLTDSAHVGSLSGWVGGLNFFREALNASGSRAGFAGDGESRLGPFVANPKPELLWFRPARIYWPTPMLMFTFDKDLFMPPWFWL